MTIHSKAVGQYFTLVLLIFQFSPVCNFQEIHFELDAFRSEKAKMYSNNGKTGEPEVTTS